MDVNVSLFSPRIVKGQVEREWQDVVSPSTQYWRPEDRLREGAPEEHCQFNWDLTRGPTTGIVGDLYLTFVIMRINVSQVNVVEVRALLNRTI